MKTPPLFDAPKAPAPAGFDDFWAAYPRRVSRHAAEKAWRAALKVASAADLVAAAERFAAAEAAKGTGQEFIAHAATWLNQRRWQDYAEVGIPTSLDAVHKAELLEAPQDAETQRPQGSEAELLRAALDAVVHQGATWDRARLGPAPGERGCRVPPHAYTTADVQRLRLNEHEAQCRRRAAILETKSHG